MHMNIKVLTREKKSSIGHVVLDVEFWYAYMNSI